MISKEINEDNDNIEYDNDDKIQVIDLSEYEEGDLLAYGSYGRVYKAIKKTDQKSAELNYYSAKIFKKEPNSLKFFFKELSICSRISHLSLKKLYGYSLSGFDKNDGPMLLTEYYNNNSLDTLLELERKRKVSDI